MLTIQKLLQHPHMRETELLSGKRGIFRPVEWACFVDILDDPGKVQAQELVITTGYGLGQLGWEADRVISNLFNGRAAGLALQLGIYLQELPAVILAEADSLSFPVMVIPDHVSCQEILSVFSDELREGDADRYEHLAMFELGASLDSREREKLISQVLGPLLYYDQINGSELVLTIQAFLRNGCNLNKTADKMKLHRHTIRYRLQKVEALTGQAVQDYYSRLNFQLALFLSEL